MILRVPVAMLLDNQFGQVDQISSQEKEFDVSIFHSFCIAFKDVQVIAVVHHEFVKVPAIDQTDGSIVPEAEHFDLEIPRPKCAMIQWIVHY
jgi:hypothetical protein